MIKYLIKTLYNNEEHHKSSLSYETNTYHFIQSLYIPKIPLHTENQWLWYWWCRGYELHLTIRSTCSTNAQTVTDIGMQLGKKIRMSELITNFFNFQNNSMVSVASEKAA